MSTEFVYYIFCIIAAIVAFVLLKKITGCMIKTAIAVVVAIVLAAIYLAYFR